VVVGRKQNWSSEKTLSILSLGAFVHMLSTIAVGIAVGYMGRKLDQRFETFHGIIPGLILIAFGGYFLSNYSHSHREVSERAAASSLVIMLGLSPCVVVAPFFLILGPMGMAALIKLSIAISLLNVAGMTLFGWLAMKGLNALKLQWLEHNEGRVVGAVLVLLGVSFIIL
jgi:hypothetical protein